MPNLTTPEAKQAALVTLNATIKLYGEGEVDRLVGTDLPRMPEVEIGELVRQQGRIGKADVSARQGRQGAKQPLRQLSSCQTRPHPVRRCAIRPPSGFHTK